MAIYPLRGASTILLKCMSSKPSRGAWAASLLHAAERFFWLVVYCRGDNVKKGMDAEVCKHHTLSKQGAVPISRARFYTRQ